MSLARGVAVILQRLSEREGMDSAYVRFLCPAKSDALSSSFGGSEYMVSVGIRRTSLVDPSWTAPR